MRRTLIVLITACLLAPASAAARAPITGRLSKPGYTVIALSYDGHAVSSHSRSFRIVPRSSTVTLQLRDAKGRYAGPVVVGGTRTKAIVGVKAGARLGKVKVLAGYAKTAKRVAARWIDARRTAQAAKGVPRGNGRNFGLVRSTRHAAGGAGRDQDLDGVPDALDIDADGDLVLNNEDRSSGAKARAAQQQPPPQPQPQPQGGGPGPARFSVFSQIGAQLERSVNANASGVTADIDRLVQGNTAAPPYQPIGMFLVFQWDGGQAELDCGGLSYCSKGGTGRIRGERDPGPSFPDCCDSDGDGLGEMTGQPGPGGTEMQLYPMATSAQIKSGDVLLERATANGAETENPATLNFVFNTTPALVSWTSSGDDAGSVTYPVPQDAPGTGQNPFQVKPGPDGKVAVTMTFWRPQRRGIPGAGETAPFMDLGHMLWQARLVSQSSVTDCSAGYSTTDAHLTPSGDQNLGGFVDSSADAPADPANKLTFTLSFDDCLAAKGSSWKSGDVLQLEIVARSPTGGDNSAQQVFFKHQ
jgi:hypothetical protein